MGMCRLTFSVPSIFCCCMTLVAAIIWAGFDYVHQDWDCFVAITDAGGTSTYNTFLVLVYYFGIFAFATSLFVFFLISCCPCVVVFGCIDKDWQTIKRFAA